MCLVIAGVDIIVNIFKLDGNITEIVNVKPRAVGGLVRDFAGPDSRRKRVAGLEPALLETRVSAIFNGQLA